MGPLCPHETSESRWDWDVQIRLLSRWKFCVQMEISVQMGMVCPDSISVSKWGLCVQRVQIKILRHGGMVSDLSEPKAGLNIRSCLKYC